MPDYAALAKQAEQEAAKGGQTQDYSALARQAETESSAPAPQTSPEKPLNTQASDYIADPSMTPDTGWKGQLERFGQGTAEALTNPILHPIDTARSLMTPGTIQGDADMLRNAAAHPANAAGQIAGGAILGHLGGGVSDASGALKDFATTDPQVAAMKGLRVPAGSKNANPILGKVQTASPYLQGVQNLKELQGRIPGAKTEVYQPYQDYIDANRHASLDDSTVGDLYDRDKEITAQLAAIKSDPAAMQQAVQKGLNQADLINEQKAIRAKLFPAAEASGVDATGINKTYGALKGIEKQVAGKNTIAVPEEPTGFGRLRNLKLDQPLKALDEIKPAAKDILNGRFWSGNPVDMGIEDAFKTAGPKPNLGKYTPPARLALPAMASDTVPEATELAQPHGQVFPRFTESRLKRSDLY